MPISWTHPFGTDGGGKDLLSQVLVGARTTLFVTVASAVLAAVVGLILGISSAILPRIVGESLAYLIDVLIALPTLILALVFVAALGGSLWTVSLAIGIGSGVVLARVVQRRGVQGPDPGLRRDRRRLRLVDLANHVAPRCPEHLVDRDRPAVADRCAGRAGRSRPQLPRLDAGVHAVVGPDARRAAAHRHCPSWRARVPWPRGRGRDPRFQPARRRAARRRRSTPARTRRTASPAISGVVDQLADPVPVSGSGVGAASERQLLEVEDLRVEIAGRAVVDGMSFRLERAGRLGVIGESGSGKTLTAAGHRRPRP